MSTSVAMGLEAGTAVEGADAETQPVDALALKLSFLRGSEDRLAQPLPAGKDCLLSYFNNRWDATPSTSCGSRSPRTRASSEELGEPWLSEQGPRGGGWREEDLCDDVVPQKLERLLSEEAPASCCDADGRDEATEGPTSGSTCSRLTSTRSSGYCSLSSLIEHHPATASPQKKQSRGCLTGCLQWLSFGPRSGEQGKRLGSERLPEGSVEYDLNALERVGLLGCGSFGSVTLEKCRLTGQKFALKAVSKGLIVERGLHFFMKMEKAAMQRCNSPFIVRLAATFNQDQYMYFLLEAVLGGDLYAVYSRRFLTGSEQHARFYTACMVRALEHLHQQRIIYRDIKMENVVLDARGYGKLCDFGLAAVLSCEDGGKAYTVCGTPEYMAPEVAEGSSGYTRAADWWSLGVLIYEFMVGDTPFSVEDPSLVHMNVARGIEAAQLPVDGAWTRVVSGLLQVEPSERLPMTEWGVEGLEKQAWFVEANFDWQAHATCAMRAPYVPSIEGSEDLSNFSMSQQVPPPVVYYNEVNVFSGWDANFEERVGPRLCQDAGR